MGQNFDDYPDFQPKITLPKHFYPITKKPNIKEPLLDKKKHAFLSQISCKVKRVDQKFKDLQKRIVCF